MSPSLMTLWLSLPALAAPDAFAPCEEQRAYFIEQQRPQPQIRPSLWWIEDDIPCPYGTTLVGQQPPVGHYVGCQDKKGRRYGLRTEFGLEGKVALETRWEKNRELGPRIEWDPKTYLVSRQSVFREGRLDGESLSWLDDGGVLVTTYRRGARDGATFRIGPRGELLLVESWRLDMRHGRSCNWNNDVLVVDQTYLWGEPTVLTADR